MIHYLRVLAARLRGLFGDRRADREFDDEIETHLRMLTERYVRQGMTEAEAAQATRRQFGNVTLLKEEHRDMRAIRLIETFIQDLRYGARTLLKTPGFTLIIVITLALGIGVNTVILSTVNGFLLRGLAVEKPAELMSVFWGKKSDPQVWDAFSYPNYIDTRNRTRSFSGLAAWTNMYSASLNTTASRAAFELRWQSRSDDRERQRKAASKTKYTCPQCNQNAWAKPGASLICGVCYDEDGEICVMEAEV